MAKKIAHKTSKKAAQKAVKKTVKKPALKTAKKAAPKAGKKMLAKSASKSAPKVKAKSTSVARVTATSAGGLSGDFRKVFSPLDDRVLIAREVFAARTASGLYIPDSVATAQSHASGRVLALGPGRRDRKGRRRQLDVKIGDEVLFAAYVGSEIEWGGQKYVILREEEILCVQKA